MEPNEEVVTGEQEEIIQPRPEEVKARTQGWIPKEEFKGDPEKWIDAQQFIDRGEKIIPILKERNDHLVKEVQEMKQTFSEYLEYSKKSEERAFQKAMQELQARKENAVEMSDIETFRAVEKEQLDLMKDRQETPQSKPSSSNPVFETFVAKNDWYKTDPEMRLYADNIGSFIHSSRGLTGEALMVEVEKEVKGRYADRFQNIRRETASPVEGVSETGIPQRGGKKTYNDLPADAKAAYERMAQNIKQRFGKEFTREEYVKNYDWD